MRVFTAGIITETNTFAPWPTGKHGFLTFHGDATTRGRNDETGVLANIWKTLAQENGHEFVESVFAQAQPSGPTVHSVYEAFRNEMRAGCEEFARRRPIDPTLWDGFAPNIFYQEGGYDDPQAFVAHVGQVNAGITLNASWRDAVGRGSGEAIQLKLTGHGTVYVQASEQKIS